MELSKLPHQQPDQRPSLPAPEPPRDPPPGWKPGPEMGGPAPEGRRSGSGSTVVNGVDPREWKLFDEEDDE